MKSPDTIIAEAFERHCKENHQADYEVCQDLTCQAAYALERLFWPLCNLEAAAQGVLNVVAELRRQDDDSNH